MNIHKHAANDTSTTRLIDYLNGIQHDAVREANIKRIIKKINQGVYVVDSKKIAAKMVEEFQ